MSIILINAGAKVDATNSRAQSALHFSVDGENIIEKKLLSCGIKVCIQDKKYLKAIGYLNKNIKKLTFFQS